MSSTAPPPSEARLRTTRNTLRLAADLAVNLFLPWLAYRLVAPAHGELTALLASSVPPLGWSLMELAWHRRIDALSALILAGIALSVLAMALGGDARLLLVRESMISGLIGLAFLGSLLIGKPLIYFLARATMLRQNGTEAIARFQAWSEFPLARRGLRAMTLAWGLALSGEAALRCVLALSWPPEQFLAIVPPLGYAVTAALGGWTFWYSRRLRAAFRRADNQA